VGLVAVGLVAQKFLLTAVPMELRALVVVAAVQATAAAVAQAEVALLLSDTSALTQSLTHTTVAMVVTQQHLQHFLRVDLQ
jgi:hypothetical protein